jgi:3-carboxy-cis,cis-muconate cycloisomerase
MTLPTLDPGFSTEAMARAFGAEARVRAMCRVEEALARAGAKGGTVPADAAQRVAEACRAGVDDPGAVLARGWEDGTPVLPLLAELRARLSEEDAGWLHHGATSQDVVDTALVLQAREGLDAVRADLVGLAIALRAVATAHRDTPARAWTLLQEAVPTTVGRRTAGWLSPVVTHLVDLRELRSALPVQLGGPSGTLDALGERGLDVVEALATELGLAVPLLPWHTDRTVVATLVGALQRAARTMATIGTDLALLAHDGAVRMRAGGSSSMPGKRNPIDATRAVAAAEVCGGAAEVITRGRPHELERGVGGWHAEWAAVPLVFHTAGAAVEATRRAVESLEVVGPGGDGGPTPAAGAFVDRVVAACDAEVAR